MPHETDENLSALIDGELAADDAARAKSHAESCAECARRLEVLRGAADAFRRSGARPLPASVSARARSADRGPRWAKPLQVAATVAAVAGLLLASGIALKKFTPALFNNIQQMISGAASQMGSGAK